ncbi:hypothetical protein QJS10_CPA06g02187 [Acorus calamus]|uniref:Uncharacterized protein n=1 Tax=Acorus calamus TaxID=4465 RepID=A0AAV9EMX7_ACOCL|nr:hypothetical protein QJS10_CPA06g02187 [Acorus calamus]
MASSSSSPSPPPWRLSPRPTTTRPSRPAIRRRSQPRIHLIKLSLSDPSRSSPPLKVPPNGDSDPSIAVLSSRAVSSGSSADVVVVVGGEDEARTDGNRRVRLVSLTKNKRRPLWRRTFFEGSSSLRRRSGALSCSMSSPSSMLATFQLSKKLKKSWILHCSQLCDLVCQPFHFYRSYGRHVGMIRLGLRE